MSITTVSTASIIAKVVDDTNLKDRSFASIIPVWIGEALGHLKYSRQWKAVFKDIVIDYHKGILPCGLMDVRAVEYKGKRLRYGLGSRALTEETEKNIPFCTEITSAQALPESRYAYELEGNYITTSLRSGTIRLHFYTQPCDQLGFPFIPNNQAYIESIYWYIRAKMIGRGWKDPVFSYRDAFQMHEMYGSRGLEQVTTPHIDEMQDKIDLLVRLIPDQNYWENFDVPDRGLQPSKEIATVGIPISSLIVERYTTPENNSYTYTFPSGTNFTIPQSVHKLDKVRGSTFLSATGEFIIVPFNVDQVTQTVSIESTTDLINCKLILY